MRRREREREKENEKEGPTRRSKATRRMQRKEERRGTARERIRFLFIHIPYTSFMARPPHFALSFHLVTSLRLVTVCLVSSRLASTRLASLFPGLPLTYGVDPFSNDALGKSPRYPPAESVRIASLQANSDTLSPDARIGLRSYRKVGRCWGQREKEGSAYPRFVPPGIRCGRDFRRYDEDPRSRGFQ